MGDPRCETWRVRLADRIVAWAKKSTCQTSFRQRSEGLVMSNPSAARSYEELYSQYLVLDEAARQKDGGEPGNTGKTIDHFIKQLVAFTEEKKIMNVVPF